MNAEPFCRLSIPTARLRINSICYNFASFLRRERHAIVAHPHGARTKRQSHPGCIPLPIVLLLIAARFHFRRNGDSYIGKSLVSIHGVMACMSLTCKAAKPEALPQHRTTTPSDTVTTGTLSLQTLKARFCSSHALRFRIKGTFCVGRCACYSRSLQTFRSSNFASVRRGVQWCSSALAAAVTIMHRTTHRSAKDERHAAQQSVDSDGGRHGKGKRMKMQEVNEAACFTASIP